MNPRLRYSGRIRVRIIAASLALLSGALPTFAATTINITSYVTAGAGDAYGDDDLLNITALGTVDFSPEAERFGSIAGDGTIILGSRTISLVGDIGFTGDRFGPGFFGTITGTASSKVDKRSSGTLTIGTANLAGFLGNFEIQAGTLELETASGLTHTLINRFEGPGEFSKTGDGTLILGNASNSAAYMLSPHSGEINIDAGKLVFDTTNGNFSLSHSTLGGVGTLGIQGGGPTKYLTLSGDWDAGTDFTGDIHIASTGHLRAGADDSLGDQNAIAIDSGGTLTLVGAEGFGSLSGGGTFDVGSNNAGVGADNADAVFTGLLKGSGDLTKNGTGTWTLGGSRNLVPLLSGFSGNLIATDGILAIDASAGNYTLNHSLLGGGGTLGITGNNSNTVTLAGDWDATTNFTGDIQVFSSGRLVAGANDSLGNGNAVQIDSGGRLTFAEGEAFGSVSGSGIFDLQTFSIEVGADNASTSFDGAILGSGPLTKNGTGTWTLGDADTLPSAVLGGHTGTFTIASGTVELHAATNDGTTLSNAFLGSGNLQKTGAGLLTLSGLTNSFAGNYQLDVGTLVVDTTANALSIDHSNLRSGSETTLAVAGDGTNTLTLTGDWDVGDDFSGDIQILEDGRLVVGANDSLGDGNDVQIDSGGRLTLAEGEGFGALTGGGIFDLSGHSGEVTIGSGETDEFSGQITGGAGSALTKNGAGSWILSNTSNDYVGDTTIDAGSLTLGTSGVIPDASDVTVNASGTLDVNGNSETIATLAGAGAVTLGGGTLTTDSSDSTTFSGGISESGTFVKDGMGTLTLTGANTATTTISGGTLKIGSGGSLQSAITNNADLLFDRSGTLTHAHIISGSGNLTKSGSGTLTLSAENTYTGDTTVTAGTLQLGASERITDNSDLVVNGGTFDLNDFTETLATVSGTGGTIDLGSGTLISTNATAHTYNGNITGSGTFQKLGDGTLTLGGENSLTGTIDIDAGTLALAAGNILSEATVDLSSNATLDISAEDEGFDVLTGSGFVTLGSRELILGDGDHTMTYAGVISGTGGLEKRGSGNLTLTGNNTYTGTTEITEGSLLLGSGAHLSDHTTVDVDSGAFFNTFDQTTTIGGLKGSGGVYMGDGTLSVGANHTNTTYSGFLNTTDNGTFVKVGTGTLTLTGLSLNLDNTRVESGTLSIGNGSNNGLYGARASNPGGLIRMTPSNTTISAGATLALDRSDEFQFFVNNIDGDGTFEKRGNNTIDLWGTGQQLGLFNIADGRVDIGTLNSIHNNTPVNVANGAVLDIKRSNFTVGSLSGAGTVILHEYLASSGPGNFTPTFTVGGNNDSTTFDGVIESRAYANGDSASSEFGKFHKIGTGTLTLDTTRVESRNIQVSDGTLKLGAGNIFEDSQIIQLTGSGTLDITVEGEGFGGLWGDGGTVRLGNSDLTVGENDADRSWGGSLNNLAAAGDTIPIAANADPAPGNFIKAGSGNQTLYGNLAANHANFTGDYKIDGGTLTFFTSGFDNFSLEHARIDGGSSVNLGKSGGGTMTLTGAPTNFTGDYEIETGTLAFDLSSGLTVSIDSDRFSGVGTLKKSGDGTLTMDGGDGGFTGDIEVAGGTFKSGGGGNSLSDSTSIDLVSGASFVLTGDEQFGGITGTGGTFDLAGYEGNIGYDNATNAVFSGSITSTGDSDGNIIKDGSGKLTLSGNSSYTGGTEIRAGTLALGASDILPDTGNFHVNGGIFGLETFNDTVGPVTLTSGSITGSGTLTSSSYAVKSGTLSARLGGSGGLTKTTSGTVTLSGSNSSFSGGTTVEAGTLQTANANALGTGAITVSGGILDLGGNTDAVGQVTLTSGTITNGTLSSGSGFDVRSGTVSGNFAGTGSLTKSTSGTVTLSGNNAYTGDTTVTAGTLRMGVNNTLSNSSDVVINDGTFDLNDNNDTVRSLAGTGGTLDLGSGILTVNPSSSTTFDGNVTGSGQLRKFGNGTLTLAGENGLTGTLDIQDGRVSLGPGDTSATDNALNNSVTVNVGASGTFNVAQQDEGFGTLTGSGTVEFGSDSNRFLAVSGGSFTGTFDGAGDFRHAGSGTYTLSTANLSNYSGELVSESGTLALNTGSGTHTLANAITGSGDLQKIGTGTLTLSGLTTGGFTGNYQLDAGTLAIDTSNADLAITHNDLSGADGTTLAKTGTGTLTLSGDWAEGADFESAVTVGNGTLVLGAGDVVNDTAVVTLTGGTLDISAEGEQIGNLSGTGGTVALGTNRLTVGLNNLPSTYSGALSGPGELRKAGTSTFTLGSGGITSFTGSIDLATDGLALSAPNGADDVFGGTLTGAGNLTKSGAGTLVLTGDNTYTGGTILHEGTLKAGSSGAINSAGVISFTGGTLQYGSANQTDYSGRFSQDANQAFSIDTNGQAVTFATSLISTGGTLTKKGSGTLTLATSNKHSGGTFLEGGTLIVGNDNALDDGSVTMAGGTTLSSSHNNRSLNNAIIINGNVAFGGSNLELTGNIDLGGQNRTLSINNALTETRGVIANGGLTKAGSGTLVLEGNNTYSGGTTITAGTLSIGLAENVGSGAISLNNGTLQITKDMTLNGARSLNLGGGTLDIENNQILTIANSLGGSGPLTKSGEGTLALGTTNQSVHGITLESGNITGSGTLTNTAAIGVQSGSIATRLTGNVGLTKTTAGTVTLSGTNTYTGDTTINAGTLRLAGGSALSDTGAVVLTNTAGATLDLNNSSETIGSLSGGGSNGGNVTLGSGTLTVSSGTFDGEIGAVTDTGGLTKTGIGNLTLNGTSRYQGATTIDGGTLTLGNASNTLRANSAISINNGATLALGSNSDAVGAITLNSGHITGSGTLSSSSTFNVKSGTIAAHLAGSAALTKTTAGTVTLSGDSSYSGSTTVSAGILNIANPTGSATGTSDVTVQSGASLTGSGTMAGSVTLEAGSTLAPGNSAGFINIGGDFTLNSTSIINLELAGSGGVAGTDFDQINVTGTLTQGGTLNIIALEGFTPALTDTFQLFNASSIGGTFAEINFTGFSSGLVWNTSALATTGVLSVSAVPEPSTFAALLGVFGLGLAATRRRRTQ